MSETTEPVGDRQTGCVKWFNNKAGFGFITTVDGEPKDVFVHWTSIKVENSQYKYLVQGEYVEFDLVKPANAKHEFHAVAVSGIKGGNLMCETIHQTREALRVARSKDAPEPNKPRARRVRKTTDQKQAAK